MTKSRQHTPALLADLIRIEGKLGLQLDALKSLEKKSQEALVESKSHLLSFPSAVSDSIHYLNDALFSVKNAKIEFAEYNAKKHTQTADPDKRPVVHLAKMRGYIDSIIDRQKKTHECIENIVETDTIVTTDLKKFEAAYCAASFLFKELLNRKVYKDSKDIDSDFLRDKFRNRIAAANCRPTELKSSTVSTPQEKKSVSPTPALNNLGWYGHGNISPSFFQPITEKEAQAIIQAIQDEIDHSLINNMLQLTLSKK